MTTNRHVSATPIIFKIHSSSLQNSYIWCMYLWWMLEICHMPKMIKAYIKTFTVVLLKHLVIRGATLQYIIMTTNRHVSATPISLRIHCFSLQNSQIWCMNLWWMLEICLLYYISTRLNHLSVFRTSYA